MTREERSSVTEQKHTQDDKRTSSKIKMLAEERRKVSERKDGLLM
jgi:hypothetical protein